MSVFLSVAVLLLSVLAAPLRVGAHMYVNVFENEGFVKAYFFGIRVFYGRIYFLHTPSGHNDLIIEHGKKTGRLHLNTDPNDDKSIAAMMRKPTLSAVRFEKLSTHFTVGKAEDVFATVALLQTLRVLFYAAVSVLKCRYDVAVTEAFVPDYKHNLLQCDLIGIIDVSIADIIISLLAPRKRKVKQARREVADT